MKTSFCLISALCVLVLASPSRGLTLEEIVGHMNETSAALKDIQAAAKVTKYDADFDEAFLSSRKLYFQRPHLYRIDTFRQQKGKDVLTEQFIVGKDFILRTWPPTHHGELRRLSPDEIERMANDRNDPISFFGRSLEDIRKDFSIEQVAPPKDTPADSAVLAIRPTNPEMQFEYSRVEMVIDTKTWLPRTIKSFVKGKDENLDWVLYEFSDVKVNPGLKTEAIFPERIPGIRIEVVEEKKEK